MRERGTEAGLSQSRRLLDEEGKKGSRHTLPILRRGDNKVDMKFVSFEVPCREESHIKSFLIALTR